MLFPLALWRAPVVRWFVFVLNGLMLVAAPAYGSHYVVDVIAGVIVAIQCRCEANASRRIRGLAINRAANAAGTDVVRLSREREQA